MGSVDTHEPMYSGSTRGLVTLVKDIESILTDEYPAAPPTIVWVDHVSHNPFNYQNDGHQPDNSLAINNIKSAMTTPHPPKAASPRNPPSLLPTDGTSQ
jgi:hypothetical protein